MQNSLATERLILEEITPDDAAFILELLNTEGWLKFIGNWHVGDLSAARTFIRCLLEDSSVSYQVFRQKDTQEKMGVVTLKKRGFLPHKDIGYGILPAFIRQGYAYEAVSNVLNAMTGKEEKILAITLKDNLPSVALLEKLGMTFEKEMQKNAGTIWVYGKELKQNSL
jgi:[ribosomal protein S5]-alanine N-acetyltransferase